MDLAKEGLPALVVYPDEKNFSDLTNCTDRKVETWNRISMCIFSLSPRGRRDEPTVRASVWETRNFVQTRCEKRKY